MGKVYDQAYKMEICKRVVECGESVTKISREVGIGDNTIYGWVGKYRKKMPYRILCNAIKQGGVKASSDLASGLFYNSPLHKIRYGIYSTPLYSPAYFPGHCYFHARNARGNLLLLF